MIGFSKIAGKTSRKLLLFALLFLTFSGTVSAHALTGVDVSKLSGSEMILVYIQLGFEHILPLGLDHILFILSIFFFTTKN